MFLLRTPILILFFLLLVLTTNVTAETRLQIATSRWSPYVDEKLPNSGIAMDIVTSVFKKAGYELDVSYEKWPRTLEGTKIGIYDAVATAWYSKERGKSFVYTDSYLDNVLKLLVHSDSGIQFNSYFDLQGRLVGIVKDFAYGGEFSKAKNFMRLQANHVVQNIDRVLKKQIDATIADERVLIYKINTLLATSKNSFKILPNPVSVNTLHVAVSRANPKYKEIVSAFNKALATMKKDGSYLKIIEQHDSNELNWN